ncbi:hypothetical protein SEPCBS57363_000115 [Sporothrix epigloea]|uniref:Uncharacterized protein n=1 Tax=Sporothrix epigloea TaxID=1892477 RepID=A0ABP0D2W6_9PEZI
MSDVYNVKEVNGIHVPVMRRDGHALITVMELPSVGGKTPSTIWSPIGSSVTQATKVVNIGELQKIRDFCHNCQMHQGAPQRFKFNLWEGDSVAFNGTLVDDVKAVFLLQLANVDIFVACLTEESMEALDRRVIKSSMDSLQLWDSKRTEAAHSVGRNLP